MNDILEILRSYKRLGEQHLQGGTTLIGKAPHIAPMAWLHTIYEPLTVEEIDKLEGQLKTSIPEPYRAFLQVTNGLNAFNTTFALYGVRRNYDRSTEGAWQPFDITLPNTYEKPRGADKNMFFIGGYDWDGSLLYIDREHKVSRCSGESAKPLNSWNSFQEMMLAELTRLCKLFDEDGKPKSNKRTTP